MVIASLGSGGAERVATTLANYWVQVGWRVTVITWSEQDCDFYVLAPGVRRVALNLADESAGTMARLRNKVRRVRALRKVFVSEQPDIVLGFMPSTNILCGLACTGTRITAIGSEHTHPPMEPLTQPWRTLRQWLGYPRLAAVSALTESSAAWLKANTGARHVVVMPNPILYPLPTEEPALNPNETQRELGGSHFLLAVGRLVEYKRFDRLLNAFARAHSHHPEWRLIILGEGPLLRDLETQRDALQLHHAIALPGAVGNIGDWYEACDAYVMTSRYEGFGNTLAEAMAYGLPSVAVDCETGPADIVNHEVDGLLVPQDNSQALDAALDRIMGDEALRARLAKRAVEARERYAVEHIAAKWMELFNTLGVP